MSEQRVASKAANEEMNRITSKFERLVLACIDASDSESRRIFQDFSSGRFITDH
jgi:hypothetical protein